METSPRTLGALDQQPRVIDRDRKLYRSSFRHRLLGTWPLEERPEIASDIADPGPVDRGFQVASFDRDVRYAGQAR